MTQYERPTVQIVDAEQLIEQLGATASTLISPGIDLLPG